MSEFNLSTEDLESLADTYDKVKDLLKEKGHNEKQLVKDLEGHLRDTVSDLSEKLSSEHIDDICELHVIFAKYQLLGLCSQKIVEFVKKESPGCSKVLAEVFDKLERVFNDLYSRSVQAYEAKFQAVEAYSQSQKDLDQVLRAAEGLEENILKLNSEKKELKYEIERISNEKHDYIEHLEQTNKSYLEKILQNTKIFTDSPEMTMKSSEFKDSRSFSPFRPRSTTPPPMIHDLTLRQVKEMIEELYTAKAKFDYNCLENKQPRETISSFISIYFTQKYGLKSLCSQWATLLNKALIRHSKDIDVWIFTKVKNLEINEEFVIILKTFKDKLSECIKNYYRIRNPYMPEKVVKALQEQVVNGAIDEDICNYFYSCLVGKEKLMREKVLSLKDPSKKKVLMFKDFLKALVEVLTEEYESKIERFVVAFRRVDSERKGFITADRLTDALIEIESSKPVEKVIEFLDPFNSNRISFSDFIQLCLNDKGFKDDSFLSIKLKS